MKTEHIKMVLLWLLVVVAIIVVTETLNRCLGPSHTSVRTVRLVPTRTRQENWLVNGHTVEECGSQDLSLEAV